MTPRRIDPERLFLKRARRYQLIRRLVLAGSVAVTLLTPLWWLALDEAFGPARGGRWAQLALSLPLPQHNPLLGAPWTVRVFGLELMDPLAFVGVVVAGGASLKVLLGVLPLLALIAVLGRFFCGWLCPYLPLVSASSALRGLLAKAGVRLPDVRLPRWLSFAVLGALVTASAVAGTQLAPLIYPPSLIAREAYRAVFQGTLGFGAAFIAFAFLFDTFVSRGGFCRTVCPGGALFSALSVRSPVRVVRTAEKCTDCDVCNVVCHLGQLPMNDKVDAGCERCGRCISACPTGALEFKFGGGK